MLSRLELSIASLFRAKPGPLEQRKVGWMYSVELWLAKRIICSNLPNLLRCHFGSQRYRNFKILRERAVDDTDNVKEVTIFS